MVSLPVDTEYKRISFVLSSKLSHHNRVDTKPNLRYRDRKQIRVPYVWWPDLTLKLNYFQPNDAIWCHGLKQAETMYYSVMPSIKNPIS